MEYEQYFIYGHTNHKINDGITFAQSYFSETHESNTFSKDRADSGSTTFGWQRSVLEQLEH